MNTGKNQNRIKFSHTVASFFKSIFRKGAGAVPNKFTPQEEADIREMLGAYKNGKNIPDLTQVESVEPDATVIEVVDQSGENKEITLEKLISSAIAPGEGENVLSIVDNKFSSTLSLTHENGVVSLIGIGGTVIASFSLPIDNFLKEAHYDKDAKSLVFTFIVEDDSQNHTETANYTVYQFIKLFFRKLFFRMRRIIGLNAKNASKEEVVSIDISDLVDEYTNGNGLSLSNNQFSIKLDPTTEQYLTVSALGLKVAGIDTALAGKVPTTRTVNSKALSTDVTLAGSDIKLTGYTKASSASAIAATDTVNQGLGKLEKNFDSYVPITRTVNSKALSANITLAGGDVPLTSYTKASSSSAISTSDTINSGLGKLEYKIDNPGTGYVPSTRTVNGKALSANITLTASDVGAEGGGRTVLSAADFNNVVAMGEYTLKNTNLNAPLNGTSWYVTVLGDGTYIRQIACASSLAPSGPGSPPYTYIRYKASSAAWTSWFSTALREYRENGVSNDLRTYFSANSIFEMPSPANGPIAGAAWCQVFSWGSQDSGYGFMMYNGYSENQGVYYRQKIVGSYTAWFRFTTTATLNEDISNYKKGLKSANGLRATDNIIIERGAESFKLSIADFAKEMKIYMDPTGIFYNRRHDEPKWKLRIRNIYRWWWGS
ncbi:MAG: pyocin knob domain-containing protein [Mediterranea sp.]|jgi:hypothetical protein|nr:pyocin knob domain-containing protein [Mediterranea sp.]